MLIECRHCGAPLDVTPQASLTRCAYCGTTQRVRSARTQMTQTPVGWQPPAMWTPPQHFRAPSVPLTFDQSKTVRKVVIIFVVVIVVTTVLPIFIVVLAVVGSLTCSAATPSRSSTRSRSGPSPVAEGSSRAEPGPASDVCQRAARCCRVATPASTAHCDQLLAVPDEQACRAALDGFVQAAGAQGKSCN
jgi:LSD1 subclass zinc finger protein